MVENQDLTSKDENKNRKTHAWISPANSAKRSDELVSEVEAALDGSLSKWAMYWFQFWIRVITQLSESTLRRERKAGRLKFSRIGGSKEGA